jgi:hypothetical protein
VTRLSLEAIARERVRLSTVEDVARDFVRGQPLIVQLVVSVFVAHLKLVAAEQSKLLQHKEN